MTILTEIETLSQAALSLAGADRLTRIAMEEARRQGFAVCIAVTDPAGHLLRFTRMDGAGLVSIDVALGKAKAAAYLGKPARLFEEMINAGATSMLSVPGILPLAGGVPVGAPMLGAIGISGATGDIDEAIAEAAARRFTEEAA